MHQLSDKDREIIQLVEFAADIPISELARRSSLRSHTLRYGLQRLLECKVLIPSPLVNSVKIGMHQYTLFFHFRGQDTGLGVSPCEKLLELPGVFEVETYAGEYDCAARFLAADPDEAVAVVEQISASLGERIGGKQLSLEVERHRYGRLFTATCSKKRPEIVCYGGKESYAPDELDIRILSALMASPFSSISALARTLGAAKSSVAFRLQRLQQRGVITGWTYETLPQYSALQSYRLLLSLHSRTAGLRGKILRWASGNRLVVNSSKALGAWDFQFWLEIERAEQLIQIKGGLSHLLGGYLSSVRLLSVLGVYRNKDFHIDADLPEEKIAV